MTNRADRDPLAKPKPVEFGVCACTDCECRNAPEKGREICRYCRRGYHLGGPR